MQPTDGPDRHCATLDVVIPVRNEAAWLERLLSRCGASKYVHNIVVSDNASTDASAVIARRYGCVLVSGGLPARARNNGARATTSPVVLFVDADTIVPDRSMAAALRAFDDAKVVAVHFRTIPLTTSPWIRGLYLVMRAWIAGLHRIGVSQGIGTAIAVRSAAFHRIGGFRETIAVGEDAVFLREIASLGRVAQLSQYPVFTSPRRLYTEGMLVFPMKVALWAILRLCKTNRSLIRYHWGDYNPNLAHKEDRLVVALGLQRPAMTDDAINRTSNRDRGHVCGRLGAVVDHSVFVVAGRNPFALEV